MLSIKLRPRLSRDLVDSRVLNDQSNRCMGTQDGNDVDIRSLVLFTSSAQPIFNIYLLESLDPIDRDELEVTSLAL